MSLLKLHFNTFKELATFVDKVYAPSWFRTKCNAKLKNSAHNLWKTIVSCKYLNENKKQFYTNAYKIMGILLILKIC